MLQRLKPIGTNLKMKRLGPDEDGGYVMPEIVLDKCVALFTYGVGYEIRYEIDFHNQYRKPIFTFDHTVGYNFPEFINHTREGLGFKKNMGCFINHYFQRKIDGPVYLKVDIEGGEYPYFLTADIDAIANLTIGLSIEVHRLDNDNYRVDFIKMMKRLSKRFTLVHTHGNNYGSIFNYQGNDILNVYELSFINTDYITDEIKPISVEYPIEGLDYPNNRNEEDFKFNFFKNI
jgi:hypothetical protein